MIEWNVAEHILRQQPWCSPIVHADLDDDEEDLPPDEDLG